MPRLTVIYYQTPAGRQPAKEYLDGLPPTERDLVVAALRDLEAQGLDGAATELRKIAGKLWELKVSRHRVFYVMLSGSFLVVLHAYKKQGQKAPPREIAVAVQRMKEVLR